MHSTQKSVIINKAICRFKHEEKEDEFHARRMESIQPLKWQEQKEEPLYKSLTPAKY